MRRLDDFVPENRPRRSWAPDSPFVKASITDAKLRQ